MGNKNRKNLTSETLTNTTSDLTTSETSENGTDTTSETSDLPNPTNLGEILSHPRGNEILGHNPDTHGTPRYREMISSYKRKMTFMRNRGINPLTTLKELPKGLRTDDIKTLLRNHMGIETD